MMKTEFLVGMLFGTLLITTVSMVSSGYAQDEYKQIIRISFFTAPPPTELVTDVEFYFNYIQSPINLRLPEFDHISWVECLTMPAPMPGPTKMFIRVTLRYSEETNESKAYQAAQDFIRVFNYSSLQLISTSNKTKEFSYTFGYFEETLDNIKYFLRFKPKTGFGSFVDKFLELCIPREEKEMGMFAYYTLLKNKEGCFWQLTIKASGSEKIPTHFGKKITIRQLLNIERSIVASDKSEILVDVTENDTYANKLFMIRTKSIFPPPNRTEIDTQTQKRRYIWYLNENQQLDNVIINLEVNATSHNSNNGSDTSIWMGIIIIVMVALIISAVSVRHIRKRQKKMKSLKL